MLYLLLRKKKCKTCHRLTHTDVLYCWYCGCSFDYRICASGHKNSRWVLHCLTCGKDRSLMSRPHGSHELSFVKHPTKPSTYVPRQRSVDRVFAWSAVGLGVTILCYMALVILSRP
jgi:hypothetical protein